MTCLLENGQDSSCGISIVTNTEEATLDRNATGAAQRCLEDFNFSHTPKYEV